MLQQQRQFFGQRNNGRHLEPSEREGRRLRSAFDVFDFVNNALNQGVQQAKHSTDSILKKLGEETKKVVEPLIEDVKKLADKTVKVIDELSNSDKGKEVEEKMKKALKAGDIEEVAKVAQSDLEKAFADISEETKQ